MGMTGEQAYVLAKKLIEAGGGGGGTVDAYTKTQTDNLLIRKVDKELGKGLFSGSYNDLSDAPPIPSKTSELQNDSGYLTEHQDLTDYATKNDLENEVSGLKSDLDNKEDIFLYYGLSYIPFEIMSNTALVINNHNEYQLSSNKSYKTTVIKVENGDNYNFYPYARICGISSTKDNSGSILSWTNEAQLKEFSCTYSGYLFISFSNALSDVYITKGERLGEEKPIYNLKNINLDPYNSLYGKTVYNFGDSVSNGAGNVVDNVPLGATELVAKYNGMICKNFAVSGSSMSCDSSQESYVYNTSSILQKVIDAVDSENEPDFVILAGGINDLKFTTIGDFNPPTHYNDFTEIYINSLDITKFSGAFEKAIFTIMNNWSHTQLIYMFEHAMGGHWSDGTEELCTRAKEICNKWSVPFLDMRHEGGLNMAVNGHLVAYGTSPDSNGVPQDSTHCNGEGYRLFYVPKLTAKMKECCPLY